MLELSEELLIQKNNELIIAENCKKNNGNYFCKTMYINAQNCVNGIIKMQNNTFCNYHEILNPMLVMKISNSDLTVIASNGNEKLKLVCNRFEKQALCWECINLKIAETVH